MADVLSDEQVAAQLEGLEWRRERRHIVLDWTFHDFAQAMAFMVASPRRRALSDT